MDAQQFYAHNLRQVASVVKQVLPEQLSRQTPDENWSVRDLINHLLYQVSWVPDIVAGHTIAKIGDAFEGDLLALQDDDVGLAWDIAAHKAEPAAANCDLQAVAHLSYTDTTNATYLQMSGGDILVHAWDLAKAIGIPFRFEQTTAQHMWQQVKDLNMSSSGLFKSELPYDETDSAQDKILAKFGRDKHWNLVRDMPLQD